MIMRYGEVQSYCDCTKIHSYPQFMAITNDAQYFYVATTRGSLKKYSLSNGSFIKDYGQVFGKVSLLKSLKFSPDGQHLFALQQNGIIYKIQ